MGAAASTEEHVSLKLLLNEKGNKVLFAEAGKDFVDVLCSFLTFPLGTIVRLVEKKSSIGPITVGCLNSLYHSVADLDEGCMWSKTTKQMLLQPSNSAEDYCNTLEINIDDSQPTKYFVCSWYNLCRYNCLTTSTNKDKRCRCGNIYCPAILKHFRQGFVNPVATYLITDDLIVMPNSVEYGSFGLLQEFGINNTRSVKELILNITKEKVLDLLKCSLLSKSTLTQWFLGKKPSLEVSRCFSCNVQIRGNIHIKLKLVIRKSDGKVLCAQGEQDFANLLLSFLTFPLGGIARIFGENCSSGSIDRLYKSISDLKKEKYFMSNEAKNRVVNPFIAPLLKLRKQPLPIFEPSFIEYCCYHEGSIGSSDYVIYVQFSNHGEDKSYMKNYETLNLSNVESPEGYVKGPAMYVATDDLVLEPLSPISAIGFLNRFNTPLNDLKEKVVTIGIKEALSILQAALTSRSALTNGLAHLITKVKEEK